MQTKLLFFIFVTIISGCSVDDRFSKKSSTLPTTSKLTERCNNNKISTIKVLKEHQLSNSLQVDYKYEKITNGQNLPTIVVIPGGPGLEGIASTRLDFIKNFNLIQVDSRGLGCNYNENFDRKSITSFNHAYDILNIIKAENLSNYVIYGVSYGTVVSTILASLPELDSNPPRAVLQGGTFSKYWQPGELPKRQIQIFNESIQFQPDLQRFLSQEEPMGIPLVYWQALAVSSMIHYGNPANRMVFMLDNQEVLDSELDKLSKIIKAGKIDGAKEVTDKIRHTELVQCTDPEIYYEIKDGLFSQISTPSDTNCSEYYFDTRTAFDSNNYEVKYPLYYITGSLDSQTPFFMTEYHYNAQLMKRKTSMNQAAIEVVKLNNAGHNIELQIKSCFESFLNTVFQNGKINNHFNQQGQCI